MRALALENLSVTYPRAATPVRNVSCVVEPGRPLAVLGPSGGGKTTLLRAIAGLEPAAAGVVRIDGIDRTRDDPSLRAVAMVFQDGALYPHLSVRDNVAFSLEVRGLPRAAIDARVREALALARLDGLESRRPASLSGGERQRAALAKAIAASPPVLLLDEPLASLDAPTRGTLRAELATLYRRLDSAVIHVTHDQEEALALGDRVAVMIDGRFEQLDTPAEVYHRPRTRAVASFVGWPPMNFIPGRCEPRDAQTVFAARDDHRLLLPLGAAVIPPADAVLGVRPQALRPGADDGWPGTVTSVTRLGAVMDVRIDTAAGTLTARLPDAPAPAPGDTIRLGIDPQGASVFSTSGLRLGP